MAFLNRAFCADLIQTVKGVLTSQFETYFHLVSSLVLTSADACSFVETGLRYLKLLLLSFTPIIESEFFLGFCVVLIPLRQAQGQLLARAQWTLPKRIG